MLKVLFVDDEPYVVEGLRDMLDWSAFGFRICGEASNGIDALEIIRLCNPDLIITDIKMPAMDGLELIRQSTEVLRSKAKFIILSGYNDFQYAQKAMRYGVSDYLLKPLDDDELQKCTAKLAKEINEERKNELYTNRRLAFLANQTIRRILNGEKKESVLRRAELLLGLGSENEIRCLLIDIHNVCKKQTDAARHVIEAKLDPDYTLNLFDDSKGRVGVILSNKMLFYPVITDFCKSLAERIRQEIDAALHISLSDPVNSIAEIPEAYRQCCFALQTGALYCSRMFIPYSDVRGNDRYGEFKIYNFEKLVEYIQNRNYDSITKEIHMFIDELKRDFTPYESIRMNMKIFELDLQKLLSRYDPDTEKFMKKLIDFNKFLEQPDLDNLELLLLDLCKTASSIVLRQKTVNSKNTINSIMEYIREHYMEDVTIKKVARQFYTNPAYLGQLIKKTTGSGFNEHLHMVRIKEAKKLLKTTDMKISSIAQAVGYRDAEYFTGKFKALTNQLPSEYKNS